MHQVDKPALELFAERLASLAPLKADEVQDLAMLAGRAMQAKPNIDIVSIGETVDHVCLVVDGLLGRFGQLRDGSQQITALHIPGDIADLHSIAIPRAASAIQALTTTTVLRIPHAALRRLAASPAVVNAFWAYSAVDSAILAQWAINLGRRSAQGRIAHFFCEMALRMEQAQRGTRYEFRLDATQAQLGDALGLTSVHVNRTLRALRAKNLISLEDRLVRIPDWEQLKAAGDFDSLYLQLPEALRRAA